MCLKCHQNKMTASKGAIDSLSGSGSKEGAAIPFHTLDSGKNSAEKRQKKKQTRICKGQILRGSVVAAALSGMKRRREGGRREPRDSIEDVCSDA